MAKPSSRTSISASISVMRDASAYRHTPTLKRFIATQLVSGRLALILGAGASNGFGLPGWNELTRRLVRNSGASRPKGLDNEAVAEHLLSQTYNGDAVRFAKAVHCALYEKADFSLAHLQQVPLVAAISAVAVSASRAQPAMVVSFNYDDTVEQYLRYFGLTVASVDSLPAWKPAADVIVFHPHGLLPSGGADKVRSGVVLARIQFDRYPSTKALWESKIRDVFTSHTCLFIGLSGDDANLSRWLTEAKDAHPGGHLYWGIRFSDARSGSRRNVWRIRGVWQETLANYEDLPTWLFDVCQKGAELRGAERRPA